MGKYKDSDCVGCEHCVNCGRKYGFTVYVCDKCGYETTEESEITEVGGLDLCSKCRKEVDNE